MITNADTNANRMAHMVAIFVRKLASELSARETLIGEPLGEQVDKFSISLYISIESGGQTGIRTLGTITGTTVFETAPFDHSGICPHVLRALVIARNWRARATERGH